MNQLNILVVDDDRDFAESLSDVLELDGHKAMLAGSGEEAINLFKENDFDLTFMDVKLPGKNGVESFFEIRRLKPSASVIMMTGYSVPQLLEEAVENSAWDILRKPFEIQKVVKMIEKVKPCGVLIVDDDPDFLEGIQFALQKEGYTTCIAKDSEKALKQIQTGKVDVLVLDFQMPVLSGLDTFLKIKETGNGIPTIIMTPFPIEEAETISTLESLCVYGVLKKPFDTKSLFDAISNICNLGEEDKKQ